jgi:hypothetical protein
MFQLWIKFKASSMVALQGQCDGCIPNVLGIRTWLHPSIADVFVLQSLMAAIQSVKYGRPKKFPIW